MTIVTLTLYRSGKLASEASDLAGGADIRQATYTLTVNVSDDKASADGTVTGWTYGGLYIGEPSDFVGEWAYGHDKLVAMAVPGVSQGDFVLTDKKLIGITNGDAGPFSDVWVKTEKAR